MSGVADKIYVQNVQDTAGNTMTAPQMFVLFLDTSTTLANLVITEIMYNPAESGTDSTEFIEFLNNGTTAVNLMNYTITYGTSTHTISTPIMVNPGERFLVAPKATVASTFYGVPFYQGSTFGISNSGATIKIFNGSGILVDSVMYDDAAPWPVAADEGGYSLSLCDPSLDNNNGANWGLGTVYFATVNTHDVYADPGQGCVVPVDNIPPVVDTAFATDLSTIKVVFNEVVDNVTAETIANYTGLAGIGSATLNASMDTVTLALSTPLLDNVADTVCISGVEDTAGNVMAAAQCFRVIYSVADLIPPTAINAWPETHAVVKVKFSEAMDDVTAETVANYTGLAGIGSATLNTTMDTVTLALSINLINGVADTLYVQNVEDTAGNVMTAPQMFVLFLDTSTGPKALVITEIMYNPPESGTDSLEFIEIYNNDIVTVNLEGYVLKYGTATTFTFPAGLFVNPGEFVLVAPQAIKATAFYGVTFMQGATGGISNSGTTIKLLSPNSLLVDSVKYLTAAPWATEANGNGYSLSLCNPDLDNNVAGNWSLGHNTFGVINAKTVYADPGQGCATSNDSVPPIATHAWLTNFSTVKVRFNEAVDAVSAENGTNYTGLGTISNALLNTSLDTVTLTLATPMVSGVADSLFVTNISDTSGNVMTQVYSFRLMLDTTSTIMDLVISEIMYNSPESGIDSLEFIEIYNNDAAAVDLLNYKISYGSVYKVFDASYVINPGEYAIIAPNKAAADAFYGISSIQGPATGITNSGTFVKLNSPSGLLVDSLTYATTAPWPTDAAGLGASITLCDVNADNTDGANWSASTRFVGIINAINVYADPDTTCVGTGMADNAMNEINVFPNPANDVITVAGVASAGRIEVYNNMGMLVLSRIAEGDETIIIDIADLTNGLYYINIRMKDGAVVTRPVVIIK
ncbi:Lamin Tail Domain protein [anaerobic digester metagenome]